MTHNYSTEGLFPTDDECQVRRRVHHISS